MELETRLELEYEIGKKREKRINEALQEMKDDKGLILDYLSTGNLTFSIIYVKEIYKVCSISVAKTRKYWIDSRHDKHPKRAAISVDLWEDLSSIKRKIMKAIEAKEKGWLLKSF